MAFEKYWKNVTWIFSMQGGKTGGLGGTSSGRDYLCSYNNKGKKTSGRGEGMAGESPSIWVCARTLGRKIKTNEKCGAVKRMRPGGKNAAL